MTWPLAGHIWPQSSDTKKQAREELGIGACSYRAQDYAAAQHHFENAARLDPTDKLGFRYASWAAYKQYQKGVKSAANLAKGREVISNLLKVIEVDPSEIGDASRVADMYADLEPDRLSDLSIDQTLPKPVRLAIYIKQAAQKNTCANDITDSPETRHVVTVGGKSSYRYKMPANRADFDRGKTCAREGLVFANKAVELEPDSENAVSYKASLLYQSARFAEMENDVAAKASYQKQADAARANFKRLDDIARRKQDLKDQQELNRPGEDPNVVKIRNAVELAAFTATGKLHQVPLDRVGILDDPFYASYSVLNDDEKPAPIREATPAPKTWKPFVSEANGFSIMMPSFVDVFNNLYSADDENVRYMIFAKANTAAPIPIDENAKLETVAWAIASSWNCESILSAKHICDVSLIGKSTFATHPALIYHVKDTYCDKARPGFIEAIATKDWIYVLSVAGAEENDPRAKRFIDSLKITEK
jgi:tetratricopeptide (TPR) repeat protein